MRLAAVICLLSSAALAQPFTSDRRLLLSEGVLRGSPRLLGIAGAFVGVAEGAEGITRNPAAAAAKSPYFESDFNFDFGAALHFEPWWAVHGQDWDNDGRLDQVESPVGPVFSNLGTQVIYLAGSVQYKNVGLGLGVDFQNFLARIDREGQPYQSFFNLNLAHAFGSLAISLWEDQILLGLGAESTHAFFVYSERRSGELPTFPDSLGYHGWGIQFGALWRPKHQDYRFGFAYRPQALGNPTAQKQDIAGYVPFSQVVAPARISLGASWALGAGRHYNITGRDGWMILPEPNVDGTPKYTAAMTKWLITTQLDVFWPVQNATYVAAFLEQHSGQPAVAAGNQISFLPRAAVEKEVIADRLRLRLGGYIEPPLVPSAPPARPHVTFGFELYLFRLGAQRISFGLSFDLASRFQNLSVAFLVWK